ncbi:MAG: ACP S-malonyltransferase [Clostridiaceae bacterium]|nr:ACP S-malonyltransferase [Clostridiaceae bacterium]
MGKIAFIFPGQGAQYVGMAKEISLLSKSAENIIDEATEALGIDMKQMLFESSDEVLKVTENTQPAILTASIACAQPLLEAGIIPDYTSGLSLGEYSAHVLSGSLSFKDAVKIVRKRGKFMQEAVPVGKGSTAALIGLSREDVYDICNNAGELGIVEPTNFNCPGQIVIAGENEAVDKAIKIAGEKGAKRAIKLNVSAPFHCSLLKPAGEKLREVLTNIEVNEMKIPVVTNVTGKIIKESNEIKKLLIKQVSSPVLWEDCIRTLIGLQVNTFIEIGPGKVLTGFMKRIDKSVRAFNVEDKESLERTLAAIKSD